MSAILRAILARFILVNRVMMMIAVVIAGMIMMLPISHVDGQDFTARKLNRGLDRGVIGCFNIPT